MGLYHNSKVKEEDQKPWHAFMPHEHIEEKQNGDDLESVLMAMSS